MDFLKKDSFHLTKGETEEDPEDIGAISVKWWMNLFGALFIKLYDADQPVYIFFHQATSNG